MLLNSISAIGKYRPSIPQNCTITTMSSTSYNAGYGGSVKVTSTGSTDPGRGTIDYYGTVILDSGYNQVASANLSASQLSAGYTFTGLDITKTYFASIASHNEVGFCASNANTNTVTVHSAPQAGGGGITIGGVGSGTISASFTPWSSTSSAPYSSSAATPGNGNLAITSIGVGRYDVTLANDEGYSLGYSNSSPVTMAASSFTKGHTYQLYLVAQNADGISYPSSYSGTFKPNP